MNACPACGGDRDADRTLMVAVLRSVGIASEHVDPGGRELVMSDGSKLRLTDECNMCDMQIAREFVESKGAK